MAGVAPPHPASELISSDRTDEVASEIVRSEVTVTSFSTVADLISIGMGPNGSPGAVRPFDDASGVADHSRQLDVMARVARTSDLVEVRTPGDVERIHANGESGYFISCEGGDFIGVDPSRLAAAKARGV
jgi:hypothetical protein